MERLNRSIGAVALFFYGLGDILGAGIYALIGKVAAESGTTTWLSFSLALAIALLTALSYSELTSRHPYSGGASYFAQKAFDKKNYAFIVGWLLLCVSVVSMATLANAFNGYIEGMGVKISPLIIMAAFFILLTLINLRGIKQSSMVNIISTSIEVIGLIVVAVAGIYFLNERPTPTPPLNVNVSSFSFLSILQGSALAFYAFIGFEDLANVAEEVKNPKRNLPMAIMGSLITAGFFYVFIGWLSTQVMSTEMLAKSTNPMTDIVEQSKLPFPLKIFGGIALFAVANTCLLNFITASRLLYGMAEQDLLPDAFEKVHKSYKTPTVAILSVSPVAFILASIGHLSFLAGTTSVLILLVFCSTNLSLIKIKKDTPDSDGFRIPKIIPWIALATNILLISLSDKKAILAAAGFFVAGALLFYPLHAFRERQLASHG